MFSQIGDYIAQRSTLSESGVALGCISEEYATVFRRSPSVLELVRNPFVLRLFVEALPSIVPEDRERLTRYTIYRTFVQQWFGKEVAKMRLDAQAKLGLADGTVTWPILLDRFELLSALLAGEILKAGVLDVTFDDGAGSVWSRVQEVANEWVINDVESSAGTGLSGIARRRAVATATDAVLAAIDALQSTCPLRRVGGTLQFIH